MNQLVQLLKGSILFSHLSEETIENEILPLGRIQEFPKGHHLIRFQETIDTFGILIKGRINLLHIYGNGNYGIMGILEEGDLYGMDLACTKSRISPYYAETVHQTQVFSFPADLFISPGFLREEVRTQVLERMLCYVADENMRKEYRLAILFQKGLRERIMTFLIMQANKHRSKTFKVPFSRGEMASYLCVNRTCLSHELSLMEQEGILRFSRNTFTLLNWNGPDTEF